MNTPVTSSKEAYCGTVVVVLIGKAEIHDNSSFTVFACLGFLSPANRGALMTCALVLWVCLGTPAGYVSARIYKSKVNLKSEGNEMKPTVWKLYPVIHLYDLILSIIVMYCICNSCNFFLTCRLTSLHFNLTSRITFPLYRDC